MGASSTRSGLLLAAGAFTIWGLAPIYFKQVASVPTTEVLSHRVVWSFLILSAIATSVRLWPEIREIILNRQQQTRLLLSSFLISLNWLTFIWAVANDRITEASLGYFITPLVNVMLGNIFFREVLSRGQIIACLLAGAGVIWQLATFGSIPIIALTVSISFGFYGLVRKQANMPVVPGLLLETSIMLPFAIAYLLWLAFTNNQHFRMDAPEISGWLIAAGLVTTIPLLMFTGAATRLKLTTLGFMQYLGPTLSLLLAIFIYGEPFERDQMISFLFIWLALVIFSLDGLKTYRRNQFKQD